MKIVKCILICFVFATFLSITVQRKTHKTSKKTLRRDVGSGTYQSGYKMAGIAFCSVGSKPSDSYTKLFTFHPTKLVNGAGQCSIGVELEGLENKGDVKKFAAKKGSSSIIKFRNIYSKCEYYDPWGDFKYIYGKTQNDNGDKCKFRLYFPYKDNGDFIANDELKTIVDNINACRNRANNDIKAQINTIKSQSNVMKSSKNMMDLASQEKSAALEVLKKDQDEKRIKKEAQDKVKAEAEEDYNTAINKVYEFQTELIKKQQDYLKIKKQIEQNKRTINIIETEKPNADQLKVTKTTLESKLKAKCDNLGELSVNKQDFINSAYEEIINGNSDNADFINEL